MFAKMWVARSNHLPDAARTGGTLAVGGGRGLKMWLNGRSHLKAGLERFLLILNRCGIPTGAIL